MRFAHWRRENHAASDACRILGDDAWRMGEEVRRDDRPTDTPTEFSQFRAKLGRAEDAAASAASSSSMPYKRRRRAEGFPAPRCPDGETPDVAAARARRDGCVRQALAEEGVVAQTMRRAAPGGAPRRRASCAQVACNPWARTRSLPLNGSQSGVIVQPMGQPQSVVSP